jgi:hypothetical protein
MANLTMSKLANFRIFAGLVVSAGLASAMCAQAPRQLLVEVAPNQQIRILASGVSYGEVLRALQKELGWEIEVPPLANELKISHVRIETTQPTIVLAKLLEGSGLDYALLAAMDKSPSVKVVVIPSSPREASVTHETVSSAPIPDNVAARASLQAPTVTTIDPIATGAETIPEWPEAGSAMTLSEAINIMGVPAGVSPSDVGRAITMTLSEATNAMGVPAGVSPSDVGRAITMTLSEATNAMGVPAGVSPSDVGNTIKLPLSEAARMMGIPPGMSPSDVGKTAILPLPIEAGKRP